MEFAVPNSSKNPTSPTNPETLNTTWPVSGHTFDTSGTYRIKINCIDFNIHLVVGTPVAIGGITGLQRPCRNSTGTYSIPAVAGATSYQWTLPSGVNGTSTTNTITVNFSNRFRGGQLSVVPVNQCGGGSARTLNLALTTLVPAGRLTITGPAAPAVSGAYSVNAIAGATTYTWSVNNSAVSIVSGQGTTSVQLQLQPGFIGTFILRVTASNCQGNGAHATRVIRVSAAAREMASGESLATSIDIYPNPNSGVFTLRTSSTSVDKRVEIYSVNGRLVYQETIPANTTNTSIDLEGPAAGLYQVRLVAGEEVIRTKVVVQ